MLDKVSIETRAVESPVDQEPWSRELLVAEVQRGIEQVSRIVVMQLNDQRSAQDYEARERKISFLNIMGNPDTYGVTAYEFANFEGSTVYRTLEGDLYSVPIGEILQRLAYLQ